MWADLYHLNHGSDPIFTPFKGPAHKDHHTIPGEGEMRDMYVIHYQPKTPPSKLWNEATGSHKDGPEQITNWEKQARQKETIAQDVPSKAKEKRCQGRNLQPIRDA